MRTYSHALLTWTTARRVGSSSVTTAWAAVGATLPDLPALTGGAWLWRRRALSREKFDAEVCGRRLFRVPDAALHSALPVAVLLTLRRLRGASGHGTALAFLLGWAGHVMVDALTHAEDARPLLWPLSERRFRSPVSYRDRAHYGRPFTVAEHGALLLAAGWLLRRRVVRKPLL